MKNETSCEAPPTTVCRKHGSVLSGSRRVVVGHHHLRPNLSELCEKVATIFRRGLMTATEEGLTEQFVSVASGELPEFWFVYI